MGEKCLHEIVLTNWSWCAPLSLWARGQWNRKASQKRLKQQKPVAGMEWKLVPLCSEIVEMGKRVCVKQFN